jgi:Mce-associated membrane protein
MTPHRSARGASAPVSAVVITGCAAAVAAVVWSASSCSHAKSPAAQSSLTGSATTSLSVSAPSSPTSPTSPASPTSPTSAVTPVPQDPALLKDASGAVDTLNTMDYRNVDSGLDAWLGATSGQLHAQMTQTTAMLKLQFANQHISMSGKILTIRVDAEDTAAGTARVSGTDDVRITSPGSDKTNHDKFQAQLVRTNSGWKLTKFDNTAI